MTRRRPVRMIAASICSDPMNSTCIRPPGRAPVIRSTDSISRLTRTFNFWAS